MSDENHFVACRCVLITRGDVYCWVDFAVGFFGEPLLDLMVSFRCFVVSDARDGLGADGGRDHGAGGGRADERHGAPAAQRAGPALGAYVEKLTTPPSAPGLRLVLTWKN